jgi:hypothetical protein
MKFLQSRVLFLCRIDAYLGHLSVVQCLAKCHNISYILAMKSSAKPKPDTLSINVRVSGALKRHVEARITQGEYESVSEYIRDLIRKDKERLEQATTADVDFRS